MSLFRQLVSQSSASALSVLRTLEANPATWQKLPTARSGASHDFLLGGADSEAGRKCSYRFFVDKEERALRGVVHYGSHCEGPRRHVHGGATASVLDVACGSLCWWLGEIVVTGQLTVKYMRLIPLGASLVLDARVTEVKGKKLLVSASLSDASEEAAARPFAEAQCTFIQIDKSKVGWLEGKSWEGGGAALPPKAKL